MIAQDICLRRLSTRRTAVSKATLWPPCRVDPDVSFGWSPWRMIDCCGDHSHHYVESLVVLKENDQAPGVHDLVVFMRARFQTLVSQGLASAVFGTIQRDLVALLHRLAAGSNETVNTYKYGGKGPAEDWNRLDIDCLDRYN